MRNLFAFWNANLIKTCQKMVFIGFLIFAH